MSGLARMADEAGIDFLLPIARWKAMAAIPIIRARLSRP